MKRTMLFGRRASVRRQLGAIGGFTGITIALLLTSLVSVPSLIAFLGSSAWANISVVQSVAGVGGVLVLFGWGVTGPAQVAAMRREELADAYRESLLIRLCLIVVVCPGAVLVAILSSGLNAFESLVGTVAFLLPALGASWVFIGVADARLMFLLDAGPRIAANLAGLAAAGMTHSVLAYLLVQLAGGMVLVVASSMTMHRRFGRPAPASLSKLRHTVRQQSSGVLSAIAGSAYTSVPVIFVGAVGGARRDEILLALRVLRISITASAPLTQYLQGWAPRRDGGDERRLWRIRIAIKLAGVTGLAATVGLALLLPGLSVLVSGGQIAVSTDVAIAVAVAVGAIVASQTIGLVCLVALENVRAVALSTITGAAVGIVSLFVLHALAHEPGVTWSVALAEAVVLLYQVVAIRRALRKFADPVDPQERRSLGQIAPTEQVERRGLEMAG